MTDKITRRRSIVVVTCTHDHAGPQEEKNRSSVGSHSLLETGDFSSSACYAYVRRSHLPRKEFVECQISTCHQHQQATNRNSSCTWVHGLALLVLSSLRWSIRSMAGSSHTTRP